MSWNFRGLIATVAVSSLLCGSSSAQSPMSGIASKMTEVTGDLAKTQTGKPVQDEQEAIVRDLDELIAQLEKQCSNCKGAFKKKSNNPAADSTIASGKGGIGDLSNPGESAKDWAKLSPRERDRILQSMSEGFPPEYRTVLERYYRRLAEEKTVAPGAAEKTQPKGDEKSAEKP